MRIRGYGLEGEEKILKQTAAVNATALAALFAASHDRGVQPFAQTSRHIVNLMRAIDFDCLAGGAERHFAVLATAQMLLQVGAHFGSHRIVDQIIEQGEKFSAGHFSSLL